MKSMIKYWSMIVCLEYVWSKSMLEYVWVWLWVCLSYDLSTLEYMIESEFWVCFTLAMSVCDMICDGGMDKFLGVFFTFPIVF